MALARARSRCAAEAVVTWADGLAEIEGDLHRLYDAAALAVTGTWECVAASAFAPGTDGRAWSVRVDRAGTPVAAAVFIDDTTGSVRRTTLAGTADGHRGAVPALDPAAAVELGTAVAAELGSTVREFTIGPIAPGPFLDALLGRLEVGCLLDEVEVPLVRLSDGPPYGMSDGTLRTLRKAGNRLHSDGVCARIDVTTQPGEILGLLPLLERISRERDHAAGRPSPLDDPHGRQVWQRRIQAIGRLGRLRLATLRLDDELAAYVLAIDDATAYRIIEGRFVARWARYAPGRLLEAELVHRAAADLGTEHVDWMTDVAPESLVAANAVDRLLVVRGRT
jgi:hypothetical protein